MSFEYSMGGKWLELLKQIAPGVMRVAVLRDAASPSGNVQFGVIQAAAPSLRVEVTPVNMRDADEIERFLAASVRAPSGGLIVTASAPAYMYRDLIIKLARAEAARGLLRAFLRRGRRPDVIWARLPRPVPPGGPLCRSHPQRREASGFAGAGADKYELVITSRPPKRSASTCRSRCSPAPTR